MTNLGPRRKYQVPKVASGLETRMPLINHRKLISSFRRWGLLVEMGILASVHNLMAWGPILLSQLVQILMVLSLLSIELGQATVLRLQPTYQVCENLED